MVGVAEGLIDIRCEAAAPERFTRLFEREEAVCAHADSGRLVSEYGRRMLVERLAMEEADEREKETANDEEDHPPLDDWGESEDEDEEKES